MIIQVFADPITHPFVVYEGCGDEFARAHESAREAVDRLKHGGACEFYTAADGERCLIIKEDLK